MQTYEYKHQRDVFDSKARAWTRQHAVQLKAGGAAEEPSPAEAEVVPFRTPVDSEGTSPSNNKTVSEISKYQIHQSRKEASHDGSHIQNEPCGDLAPIAANEIPKSAHEGNPNKRASVEDASLDPKQRPPLSPAAAPAQKRSKLSLHR